MVQPNNLKYHLLSCKTNKQTTQHNTCVPKSHCTITFCFPIILVKKDWSINLFMKFCASIFLKRGSIPKYGCIPWQNKNKNKNKNKKTTSHCLCHMTKRNLSDWVHFWGVSHSFSFWSSFVFSDYLHPSIFLKYSGREKIMFDNTRKAS